MKAVSMRAREGIMRTISILSAGLLLVGLSACSRITEQDLADLKDPNPILREETIRRISEGGSLLARMSGFVRTGNEKRAVIIMVEMLCSGKESKDAELAILDGLGALGKRTEIPASPLILKLKDKDSSVRTRAVETLGKIGNREASKALVELLGRDAENGYPLIWALGEIGDKGAISVLNPMLAHQDLYVRYNARTALAKIGRDRQECQGNSNSNALGILDIGKRILARYQDAMMIMFQKIAGLKNA